MNLINRHIYNKTIERSLDDYFDLEKDGMYLFEITASAKSWWQYVKVGRIFSHKDSLTVTINSKTIFAASQKQKLRADDLWNGNILKDSDLTVYYIGRFQKGQANILFIPHGTPFIKEVKIFLITDGKIVLQELTPSKRDRIPWITFLLSDSVQINSFSMMARASRSGDDDEDLQLLIDRKKQINEDNKSHHDWYWCGKALRGISKTFSKDFTQDNQPTRFDILADGAPVIGSLSLNLAKDSRVLTGRIALYQDIEFTAEVTMREDKNTTSPIVAKLKNGEKLEIIERIAVGENVVNKSNIWHRVGYREKTGYILSSFVEIMDEERERVIHIIKKHAHTYGIDENFAVSLAGCESRYKPYAVSFSGALGIFQLTAIARKQLTKELDFSINDDESFEIEKNIEGGIRYLKWISDFYRKSQDSDKKIIAAWNAGKSLIPVTGRLDLSYISTEAKRIEVKKLITCVLKNKKKKNWRFITAVFFLFLFIISSSVYAFEKKYGYESKQDAIYHKQSDRVLRLAFYNLFDGVITSLFFYDVNTEESEYKTVVEYTIDGVQKNIELKGYFANAYFLKNSLLDESLFVMREEGHQILTSLLRYDRNVRDFVPTAFIETDGRESTDLCCSYITHQPRKYGLEYDVVMYNYHRYTSLPPTRKIYEYNYNNAYVVKE